MLARRAITVREVSASADFEAVSYNEHHVFGTATPRLLRSMRGARGGDLSQLGIQRLRLNERATLMVGRTMRAYFQPTEFDLGIPDAVAAMVTVRYAPRNGISDTNMDLIKEDLRPPTAPTDAEIEAVVAAVNTSLEESAAIRFATIAAWINSNAAENEALAGVLSAQNDDLDDARTVAAGVDNRQVRAFDADAVRRLGMVDLTTLVAQCRDDDVKAEINAQLGYTIAQGTPKLAVGYSPYAEAVERLYMDRSVRVTAHSVNAAYNAGGIDQYTDIVVQVVTARNVSAQHRAALVTGGDIPVNSTEEATRVIREGDMPRADVDWISVISANGVDRLTEADLAGVGRWQRINTAPEDVPYLRSLARYAMGAYHARAFNSTENDASALALFVAVRSHIVEHALYGNSDEVVRVANGRPTLRQRRRRVRFEEPGENEGDPPVQKEREETYMAADPHDDGRDNDQILWGALPAAVAREAFDNVTDGIRGPAAIALTHISFMKSGHHISANGIGQTFDRILGALGQEFCYDPAEYGSVLALGCYMGAHPADQRCVAVMLRNMAQRGELSYAISRRITPNGPGTVGLYLLSLILGQLHSVGFFTMLKREEEYNSFAVTYQRYAAECYKETPYAQYMYGESRAESTSVKSALAGMFAYASALNQVMPNSTIGRSVALTRDANAASANTILSGLEVSAFVKSYRNFVATVVRGRLVAGLPPETKKQIQAAAALTGGNDA